MSSRVLNVPYKSQNDPDAQVENNDCGPACVAMILLTQGQSVRTADVYAASGVAQDRPLTFAEVITAAGHCGLPLTARVGLSLQDIKSNIDQGTPVIALIKYQYLTDRQGQGTTGGHFVVVVGYDDDKREIIINDPYYWGPLRDKGDHHHYDYDTWEQAWGRCNEDDNPNHSLLIPQIAQPVPALTDYAEPAHLPTVMTVYILPTVNKYGGLKLRPVRDTNVAGMAILSGVPLTVVQGPVAGAGGAAWVLARTQTADDTAGWACVQSGGEAYLGDSPNATTATRMSPITPPMYTAYVQPDVEKYGGLKLRPRRDANLSGPVVHSGAALSVVADPVGSGDNEWWLATAQDGKDTAGWVHVRQAGEVYMSDTKPGAGVSPEVAALPTDTRDVWVIATDGLWLRTQRDVPAGPGSPVAFYKQHLTALGPESGVDAKGRTWQQIRTDQGLVAWAPASENGERYLSSTSPESATAPTAAGADVRPFGKCLAGVGMGNVQLLTPQELTAVTTSRVEAFKVLMLADPNENRDLVASLRRINQNMFIVARIFFKPDSENKTRFSPQNFVDTVIGSVGALYESGVQYFEVHNEPNLELEGMGWNWASGAEFGSWLTQVVSMLRGHFSEGKFGFPGLSPQPNVPGFLDGAAAAIAQADWVGVHCYWQAEDQPPFPMTADNAGMYWRGFRNRYPDKLLMITEFSNNKASVDAAEKGRQYARYYQLLRGEANLGAAFGFALSWPAQDINHEGWVLNGQVTAIPGTVGSLIGQPGFLT